MGLGVKAGAVGRTNTSVGLGVKTNVASDVVSAVGNGVGRGVGIGVGRGVGGSVAISSRKSFTNTNLPLS